MLADVLNYVLSSRKQVGQLHRKIKTESDQLDTKKYFIRVKGPKNNEQLWRIIWKLCVDIENPSKGKNSGRKRLCIKINKWLKNRKFKVIEGGGMEGIRRA